MIFERLQADFNPFRDDRCPLLTVDQLWKVLSNIVEMKEVRLNLEWKFTTSGIFLI